MRLTSYLQEGQLTIALTGEIDHHSAKEFIHAIESKVEAYNPGICILDFTEVSFMDSSGIAVVINAMRTLTGRNGKLFVSGLRDQPLKVYKASGIDKIIESKERVS